MARACPPSSRPVAGPQLPVEMPAGAPGEAEPVGFVGLRLWVEREVDAHVKAAVRELAATWSHTSRGLDSKHRSLEADLAAVMEEHRRLTLEFRKLKELRQPTLISALGDDAGGRRARTPEPRQAGRSDLRQNQFRSLQLNQADQAKKLHKLTDRIAGVQDSVSGLRAELTAVHQEVRGLQSGAMSTEVALPAYVHAGAPVEHGAPQPCGDALGGAIQAYWNAHREELLSEALRQSRASFRSWLRQRWAPPREEVASCASSNAGGAACASPRQSAGQRPWHAQRAGCPISPAGLSDSSECSDGAPQLDRRHAGEVGYAEVRDQPDHGRHTAAPTPGTWEDPEQSGALVTAALAGRALMEATDAAEELRAMPPVTEAPRRRRGGLAAAALAGKALMESLDQVPTSAGGSGSQAGVALACRPLVESSMIGSGRRPEEDAAAEFSPSFRQCIRRGPQESSILSAPEAFEEVPYGLLEHSA